MLADRRILNGGVSRLILSTAERSRVVWQSHSIDSADRVDREATSAEWQSTAYSLGFISACLKDEDEISCVKFPVVIPITGGPTTVL